MNPAVEELLVNWWLNLSHGDTKKWSKNKNEMDRWTMEKLANAKRRHSKEKKDKSTKR